MKLVKVKKERLKRSDIIFLVTALTIPLLQFAIFYVVVNANSIIMAFQRVNDNGQYVWNGLGTFKRAFTLMFRDKTYRVLFGNSFVMYAVTQVAAQVVATFFAFCIWKKVWGFKFFSSVLFLPSVIASVVFVLIAKECVTWYLPTALKNDKIVTLFNVEENGFIAVVLFGAILGFGSNLVLQLGAMGGVDESVKEYGRLDGVNTWQQFWHIVFPHIWPTIISLFVIGLVSLFTNQGLVISFFGAAVDQPKVETFAAHVYVMVINQYGNAYYQGFPIISAMGIILSIVVVCVSVGGRRLMEKFGPSED